MAKDTELDRLKSDRDRAFQRKQAAYDAMQSAWQRRSAARDSMNRAHEAMQGAFAAQESSWQSLKFLRDRHGSQIEQLNSAQERAYENMKSAFAQASAAHDRRDGASASSYAAQGHRYKAESQGYVSERRRLVAELRSASERHKPLSDRFKQLRAEFQRAKSAHAQAKADHESRRAAFKSAKAEFDRVSTAFKTRLEVVKAENKRRKDDRRSLAQRAGVPYQYLDSVYVAKEPDGMVNFYFGGAGEPNGPGHGHYVMDRSGKVTYKRDPFDPHGAQNFQHDPATEREVARIAMNGWARRQTTGRQVQYDDGQFVVKVKSGYSTKYDSVTTDVIVADRYDSKEHYHFVIDEHGNELFSRYQTNH